MNLMETGLHMTKKIGGRNASASLGLFHISGLWIRSILLDGMSTQSKVKSPIIFQL